MNEYPPLRPLFLRTLGGSHQNFLDPVAIHLCDLKAPLPPCEVRIRLCHVLKLREHESCKGKVIAMPQAIQSKDVRYFQDGNRALDKKRAVIAPYYFRLGLGADI